MNNFDLCRQNLYNRLGIDITVKRNNVKMLAEIKRMQDKLDELIPPAKDRLLMGGLRHGSDWDHENLMTYMQKKFDIYKETGNMEMLLDFFNFIAIEGVLKTHPTHHFKAIDRE